MRPGAPPPGVGWVRGSGPPAANRPLPALVRRNALMFNNELMADVHFIVGPPGASKKVPAHKVGAERGSLRSRGFRVSVLLVPAAMRARGGRRERSGAARR